MHLPRVLRLLATTLLAPAGTMATPVPATAAAAALPPSQDPWYLPPADFESTAPGTILRIRPDPTNLTGMLANCSGAYNILYRSTDASSKPSWAVTTLLLPAFPRAPGDAAHLISYQIPYNSADVDASPSATLHLYGPNNGLQGLPDLSPDLVWILNQGWFLSIPDFEGPSAAFGAGLRAGHAVLDSVRAVLASDHMPGTAATARCGLGGYSGGSLASVFAAELAPAYAPELAFAGLAVGGVISNATQALLAANGSPAAALVPAGTLGITAEFPAAREALLGLLRTEGPRNVTGYLAASKGRIDQTGALFAFQDIGEYFVDGLAAMTQPCPLAKVFAENGQMGVHGTPQMPVFVFQAINDEIASIQGTERLVQKYCDAGANILFQRNTVGDHNSETGNGMPRAMAFLMEAFAGQLGPKFPSKGCRVENVTVDLLSAAS